MTLGACAGNAKCGSSIYRCTLDIENRTGLSHYAWNPLHVCEYDTSICYDVPCLDSQCNHGAMTRVVRMPFALTRLRPEGKCPDTVRPEGKCPDTVCPERKCPAMLRPVSRCCGELRLGAWCHGKLRPNSHCLCVLRWKRYVHCQGASRASRVPGASGRSLCVRMHIFFPDVGRVGGVPRL